MVKSHSNLKNTLKFFSTFLFLSHGKNTSFLNQFKNIEICGAQQKKDKKKEKVKEKEKGKNDRTRALF